MRNLVVILGISLVLAAAAVAGKMLGSGESFEPFVPCALAAFGFGFFGLGLFLPIAPEQTEQCTIVRSKGPDGDTDLDDE